MHSPFHFLSLSAPLLAFGGLVSVLESGLGLALRCARQFRQDSATWPGVLGWVELQLVPILSEEEIDPSMKMGSIEHLGL